MGIKTILDNGMDFIMKNGGLTTDVNIISYTYNESDYDEPIFQTVTGSNVVSGLIFPMKTIQGSQEALLLERGQLLTQDKILYVGSVNVSGNILLTINNSDYTIVPDGIQTYEVNGSIIYNKIFIRKSITGSLFDID